MIQIVSNKNMYSSFSNSKYVLSSFDEFQEFDNFNINVIDLNDENIYKNKGCGCSTINCVDDLKTLSKAININSSSKIIILFPQNLKFSSEYSSVNGYTQHKKLKDMLDILKSIISLFLIDISNIEIIYGKSNTLINEKIFDADFYFSNINDIDIIKRAKNNKSNVIINNNDLILSTLCVKSEEEMNELLKYICPSEFDELVEEPEWLKDLEFYNEPDLNKKIQAIDGKINELMIEKGNYLKEKEKNAKYKKILYSYGNELSGIVNEILGIIFEYETSNFEDRFEEDCLIKLEDVTFVIETKGLKNEVSGHNISDAYAHLIVYDDNLDNKGIEENTKCLFFVTTERLKRVSERVPIKSRIEILAKANKTLIVDNTILLNIFEDFLYGKITTNEIKEMFKNDYGILNYNKKA